MVLVGSKLTRFVSKFSSTAESLLENLSTTGRTRKQAVSICVDTVLVVTSLWAAYSLRYGQVFSDFNSTWHVFFLLPAVTVGVLASLGIYKWIIRSTNKRLFGQLIKGCLLSALALIFITYILPPDRDSNPRSIFIIYGLLLFAGTTGVRAIWQGFFDTQNKGEPVAIYGAGSAGRQLASMLSVGGHYRPVMFVDDNNNLTGSRLFGLPVVHSDSAKMQPALSRHEVTRVILAMPSLNGNDYKKKLEDLANIGLPLQTMPSVEEMVSGKARADEIRDISISDILGRREVAPDRELMGRRVEGKTVLVTGGGGSIGSELCRQIMALSPKKLIVLDNTEANLYHITEELRLLQEALQRDTPFLPVLGSVLRKSRINRLIREERVDTVYHAAAYKHVPIVEAQPDQGADTNVFGTQNVLDSAIQHGVSDFVLISTDKAVRPANAMGASKRVAEMVLQAKARAGFKTRISMVRFGNVLGSSGSVVPKFKKQIEQGGPITLTHADVTRFFMTIPEASQLVLQASAIAKGGDVFVLDMGEPVRIEDLATTMVRLYGKKLQRDTGNEDDIDIVVEGLRPGEKMYEELFIDDSHRRTSLAKIFTANETYLDWKTLQPHLNELKNSVSNQDGDAVRSQLMALAFASERGLETFPKLVDFQAENEPTNLRQPA